MKTMTNKIFLNFLFDVFQIAEPNVKSRVMILLRKSIYDKPF